MDDVSISRSNERILEIPSLPTDSMRKGPDMRNERITIRWVLCLIGSFLFLVQSCTPQPPKNKISLVGTWELVSSKHGSAETDSPVSDGKKHFKMITPTHVITMAFDPKTHKIETVHGGRCTVTPDGYTEIIEMVSDLDTFKSSFGKNLTFNVRFEGDSFIQSWEMDGQNNQEKWRPASVSD
jgi:hypothetical protein